MAINPWNKQIWVTNNGRDLLGDDLPPETVYALADGGNYGWPRCHAGTLIDPDFGHAGDCNGIGQPLVKMQAHSAPLGLAFDHAAPFPKQYQDRKSTRLNSSHMSTSYAVFCLKNKR